MRNTDIRIRAGVAYAPGLESLPDSFSSLGPDYQSKVGGAGYMSASICETPVFSWESAGQNSGNLADVVLEWQLWQPAV